MLLYQISPKRIQGDKVDLKEIKDLMRTFDKSSLGKLKLKNGDFEIFLQKGSKLESSVATQPIVTTVATEVSPIVENNIIDSDKTDYIRSPMVGTFYKAPSPESAPFVQIGDSIKAGSAVAIVEAMKIMNEIEAEFDCKILELLVSDGEPIEFDQPIFRIEKL
jgi:acetyl-CoA carboxylase biotin carboxyl carrier protein